MQITQFMRRAVQVNGHGLATRMGERSQSWHQFAERAARLAGAIQGLGLRRGDRVGILALNSDRYLEAFFGLATAGVASRAKTTATGLPPLEQYRHDFLPALAPVTLRGWNGPGTSAPTAGPDLSAPPA